MNDRDAVWFHAALAHTLLPLWEGAPDGLHALVHAELEAWQGRNAPTPDDFFDQVRYQFQIMGQPVGYVDAVEAARTVDPEQLVHDQFAKVLPIVRSLYETHGDWMGDPTLTVTPAADAPFPDETEYCACGVHGRFDSRQRTVRLAYWPPSLGPFTWAGTPRVLFHELFCHASQASPIDNADPFTEGFLDLVAQRVTETWADEVFPYEPAMARTAGSQISHARTRSWSGPRRFERDDRAARQRGSKAAKVVLSRIEALLPPSPERRETAWDELARLSICLNRVPAALDEGRTFVNRILDAHQSQSSNPTWSAKLNVVLAEWMSGQIGADRLFSFICSETM